MDRFKVSSPGMRPRRPISRCERKCDNEAHRFPAAPRSIPTIGRGRSPGLWDRAYRLPGSSRSQWQRLGADAKRRLGLLVDTPAPLTVAGAAEDLEGPGIPDSGGANPFRVVDPNPLPHLFPVSPRREVRAGTPRTSALIVQHKSRGSALRRHRESTLRTNPYTLT